MTSETHGVYTVKQLFENKNLHIPNYQRPYKWTINNITQLIGDIKRESMDNRSRYRLGTIVFHQDKDKLDIVDGQQRTVTLFLILHALVNNANKIPNELELIINKCLSNINFNFSSDISKGNLYNNYQYIKNETHDFDEKTVNFLLSRCEIVFFKLTSQTEAFQFFDSQNARGKDLEPHDLLKAYHLREMNNEPEQSTASIIEDWENSDSDKLARLFEEVLFKIRAWSKGKSARSFSKNDIVCFKGINLDKNNYPYKEQLKMINYLVNNTSQYTKLDFPFQITDYILNGRGFFEYVKHYQNKYEQSITDKYVLKPETVEILKELEGYKNKSRVGDQYTKILFDSAMLHYLDKFGNNELDQAVLLIFRWAYSMRLMMYSVRLETMDNYALGRHDLNKINIFSLIKDAIHPREVFNEIMLIKLDVNKCNNDDVDLKALFPEFNSKNK